MSAPDISPNGNPASVSDSEIRPSSPSTLPSTRVTLLDSDWIISGASFKPRNASRTFLSRAATMRVSVATRWLLSQVASSTFSPATSTRHFSIRSMVAQGFFSSGSVETFDADGDGLLTNCDRSVLAGIVTGPGEAYCFGPAASCPCGNDGGSCAGCGNTTGSGAILTGTGTPSVVADDLILTATPVPTGEWGVVFMAPNRIALPFGDGRLCAGGGIARFALQNSGATGEYVLGPGIVAYARANLPASRHIDPGETWNFQAWFRDPSGPCSTGYNTSNGFSVTFEL